MNNAGQIMTRFHDFSDGIRITMLIDRGVGNTNKGSRRWINKLISTNPIEFQLNIQKLLAMQAHIGDPNVRLYSSLNSRKLDKAINLFQHMQLDILPEQKLKFYSDINGRFCSALMKPENRETRYFLIDLDDQDRNDLNYFIGQNDIKVLLEYETPNGWHYVTEPFNPMFIEHVQKCEIKKDALILLNVLPG